jgi:hypothetical protein
VSDRTLDEMERTWGRIYSKIRMRTMRFDTYKEFLNEKIKWDRDGYWEVEGSPNIKKLQEKTGLGKGDPVKFTATLKMLYFYNSLEDFRKVEGSGKWEEGWMSPDDVKGEDINKMNLVFERWATENDEKRWQKAGEDFKDDLVSERDFLKLHLGICKVPDDGAASPNQPQPKNLPTSPGAEVVVSFYTFNPNYKKGAPRIPDKFSESELKAVAEKVGKDHGLDLRAEDAWNSDFEVILTLWYVAVGGEKLLGPFSNEDLARKESEEFKKRNMKGDLDDAKMATWRISDKRNTDIGVVYDTKTYSNAGFTKMISKMYKKDELLTLLRGRIGGKNLGLLD